MQSVSPVHSEQYVSNERVLALDQPEYHPIIVLPITLDIENPETHEIVRHDRMCSMVRFRFTDAERAAVAAGADLIVTELVWGRPFTPISFQLRAQDEAPEL